MSRKGADVFCVTRTWFISCYFVFLLNEITDILIRRHNRITHVIRIDFTFLCGIIAFINKTDYIMLFIVRIRIGYVFYDSYEPSVNFMG